MRIHLLEWRTLRGLSQRELSARSTVAQKTIAQIEGNPDKPRTPKVIGKLERALGLPLGGLQKHPSDVEPQKVTEPEGEKDDVTEEEIDLFLSQLKNLRARGNLTAKEMDEVARALAKDLILENRKRWK